MSKKYKLIGYRVVGIDYTVHREEIAEFKNGEWYPYGKGKALCNFTITEVIEL